MAADQEQTVEVFENDIALNMAAFCEEQGIADLKTESQSVWNACLMYVQRHVFPDNGMLKYHSNIPHPSGNITTNYNSYNYDLLSVICDYYIYICYLYDKEVSIVGFSKLVGISNRLIHDWGSNYQNSNRLSTKSLEIYKKLHDDNEESLSSMLISGKRNPVAILGALNRRHGWNMGQPRGQDTSSRALTAAELPRLGATEPITLPENVQKSE